MKEIKLTGHKYESSIVIVDDEDFEYLNQFKWHQDKRKFTSYAKTTQIKSGSIKATFMYRVILDRYNLRTSERPFCDHKDGNGLNNQKYNLRAVNYKENRQNNIPGRRSNNIHRSTIRPACNGIKEHWI